MVVQNKEKQEKKKTFARFILVLAVCFVLGIAAGVLTVRLQEMEPDLDAMLRRMGRIMAYGVPVLLFVLNAVTGLSCLHIIKKAKKSVALWDGEEEENIKKTEDSLGTGLFLSNIMYICNCFLYAAGMHLGLEMDLLKMHQRCIFLAVLLLFLAGMVLLVAVQKSIVDITKKINPEKRGDVFDLHFRRQWEESCDEAQKLHIYKAGYAAFKATQTTCLFLWVACVCADMAFHVGLLPVLMVSILWLVSTASYMIMGARLEK